MRDLFRSGSAAQFLLHGNVFDVVPHGGKLLSLPAFLEQVMFASYDVVLRYDRSRGVRATRGGEDWGDWLQNALGREAATQTLMREPGSALELIDRYLLRTLNLQALPGGAGPSTALRAGKPTKIAVIIEFAEFVVPRGDAAAARRTVRRQHRQGPRLGQRSGRRAVQHRHRAPQRGSARPQLARGREPARRRAAPAAAERSRHARVPARRSRPRSFRTCVAKSDVPIETMAARLTGLSRVGARTAIALALGNDKRITSAWLGQIKKELIERECQGLLDFVESPFTLDHVAGMEPVKAWLREDTELLKRGALRALPMGYLICGRIGTGKTFLVQCWAGELGIPCVVFKNFRDRWVGATESNLEKIFAMLRALGQVVVFVDEADQAAGKREGGDGDSGLSGRVYSMLAKEMSDTRNRGRIIWVFATSRPDLLEVDLKRQGRLDVHIPLFPPETPAEREALLLAIARKLKFPLAAGDLPPFTDDLRLGGNELEGVLVRALRTHELSPEPKRPVKDVLAELLREVRPNPHTRKLEYMDLVAVKECTDVRFLPPRFRDLTPEELEGRIDELRRFV